MKSGRSGRDSERREGRGGRDERWASEMGSVWRRREVRAGYTVQSHHFIVHSGTQYVVQWEKCECTPLQTHLQQSSDLGVSVGDMLGLQEEMRGKTQQYLHSHWGVQV